jgi:putative Holliday junction resolvase
MRYIGIDYGKRRVGVAVSDADGKIAFPRGTLSNDGRVVQAIVELAAQEKADRIILGDTLSHSGAANPVTAEANQFKEHLVAAGLSVESGFEAWSSIEASRESGHDHDDASAAAIILQRYLDGLRMRA